MFALDLKNLRGFFGLFVNVGFDSSSNVNVINDSQWFCSSSTYDAFHLISLTLANIVLSVHPWYGRQNIPNSGFMFAYLTLA